MASKPIRAVFAALIVAIAPLGAQVAAQNGPPPPIDRFVVFGDSLSDPGNAYIATGEFEVRPYDEIPDAPYLIGRFHFSNGATWIEQLARESGLPRSGRPALQRPGIYTNYAFGGARARPVGPFDLGTQVNRFLTDFEGVAAPDTLYVLWIGANDLRDALAALEEGVGPETVQAFFIAPAIGATASAIQQLHAAGASSFLVLNLPNVGDTPALRANGPQAQVIGEQLAIAYNTGLDAALDQLEALLDIVILRFDVFSGLEELVLMPDLAGLTNVEDSCITPDVFIGAICQPPRKYLFWDFIHPTRAAHAYVAEQAEALLETELFILAPMF